MMSWPNFRQIQRAGQQTVTQKFNAESEFGLVHRVVAVVTQVDGWPLLARLCELDRQPRIPAYAALPSFVNEFVAINTLSWLQEPDQIFPTTGRWPDHPRHAA